MDKRGNGKETMPQELTEAELTQVAGGGRRWCCRNGRWYPCGQGKRPG